MNPPIKNKIDHVLTRIHSEQLKKKELSKFIHPFLISSGTHIHINIHTKNFI